MKRYQYLKDKIENSSSWHTTDCIWNNSHGVCHFKYAPFCTETCFEQFKDQAPIRLVSLFEKIWEEKYDK